MAGTGGEIILGHKQLRASISYLAVLFLFCVPAYTQQQVEKQRVAREEGVRDHRVGEPSDLSQENLTRAGHNISFGGHAPGAAVWLLAAKC